MLPAVIVLSIMILPTITAISRDALVSVPPKLRMAAYGLGATRWEAILAVILPTASRGIFGGIVLAFGRALGETMALAMLVGNSNQISLSLFSPANTLAALLANNFPEAGAKQVERADVRGAGPARHHAGRQHRRRADHRAREPGACGLADDHGTDDRDRLQPTDSTDPFAGVDFSQLERSLRRPRTLLDFLLTTLVVAA